MNNIFSKGFWGYGESWGYIESKTDKPDAITEIKPTNSIDSNNSFPISTTTKSSGGKSRKGLSQYQKKLVLNHYALRQNTRVAVHDSSQARTILKRSVDTVVGSGLKIDPMPVFEKLGLTREEAEKWADDFRDSFHMWAKSKSSDLTGRNNLYQNMRFYAWQYGRDGDVYVRFHYSDDPNSINPLQISFVDANQIRGDEFTLSLGPTVQNDGIIKDKNGKEIGYKVWINDQEKGGQRAVEISARDEETGMPLMIHGFDPEYAGQSRGMPEMSHALQDFESITDFDTSTVKKMINSAGVVFTVANKQQDPSDMELSSLDSGTSAGVVEVTNDSVPTTPVTLGAEAVVACNLPESTLTESGVNLLGARQGDELKLVDSAAPPENSGEYMNSKFNFLASSMSMSPEIAKMLFTNSHAASRAAMGLYNDVKKIKIDDIASDFLDIVVFAWASLEIAAGRLRAPGFSDPILREAWLAHTWKGNPLPDVDPLKTRQAVNEAIKGGLTDLDTEAMNYNASSGKANRAKLSRQIPELTVFPVPEPEPDKETDDEDKDENDNN